MRYQIIKKLKNYFSIGELVDTEVLVIHGERAWKFFDTKLLTALLIIREELGKPITVNSMSRQQRGLRHNRSSMVIGKKQPYLSAHMMGKALDFSVKGMDAEEVRDWIIENSDLFDFKIRLEHKKQGIPISWVHIDTIDEEKNPKIYLFNV